MIILNVKYGRDSNSICSPFAVELGSRNFLCVHDSVLRSSCAGAACERLCGTGGCPNSGMVTALSSGIHDVEDLCRLAVDQKVCDKVPVP